MAETLLAGFPASDADVMAHIGRRESGGNDTARNPRSTATGRYQFIDSTWRNMHRQVFGNNYSDNIVMQRRNDPRVQDRIMRESVRGYRSALRSNGIPETTRNIYALHAFGPSTGARLLRTNPNTPFRQAVDPAIVRANPQWANMTVGQLISSFGG